MVEKNHNTNLSTQSIDQKRQDFSDYFNSLLKDGKIDLGTAYHIIMCHGLLPDELFPYSGSFKDFAMKYITIKPVEKSLKDGNYYTLDLISEQDFYKIIKIVRAKYEPTNIR